ALEPEVGFIPYDSQDPHSKRLYKASDYDSFDITPEQIRRSRRGYFANISYLDDKLGELLSVLERTRMADDTIVLFCSDHGDMLGERGLWFKMCFYEGAARVPLMMAGKGIKAGLIETPVSNLDVAPTLCDLAGIDMSGIAPWTDGQSLLPLAGGKERLAPVLMEYAAEGSYAPMVAIREGKYKFVHCELDPPQLFDLDAEPRELDNLAANPTYADLVSAFMEKVRARWNMADFDAAVRESQARRWVVYPALRNGAYYPWEFQPLQKASERYMRNHMNLDNLEESKRYPRGE
ncbi:MAG: choline-sulfatase, partial [Mesorhizobium sp.]